jgi:hypothetical protein
MLGAVVSLLSMYFAVRIVFFQRAKSEERWSQILTRFEFKLRNSLIYNRKRRRKSHPGNWGLRPRDYYRRNK